MNNKYLQLKEKHQEEINNFPLMFAFNKNQFAEGMKKLGLKETDTDKIISIGYGGYTKKEDLKALHDLIDKHNQEKKEAVNNDIDGTGFIFDMFKYELGNHEYCYTYDTQDTLDALGYTIDDIRADKKLLNSLLAKKICCDEDNY